MAASNTVRNFTLAAIVLGAAVCLVAAPALAGGSTAKADAARPAPDVPRRVYTNDDLGWPSAQAAATTAIPSAPVVVVLKAAPSKPLEPLQDPRWYAQQAASLEEELAGLSSREETLRRFRASSKGLPTGLVLDAPCEWITTDNLIAQLDLRRAQVLRQLDELDDTARRNGVAPGAVAEARALPQVFPQLTAEERQAGLAESYRQRAEELAGTRAEIEGMDQVATDQRMTLLRAEPGWGGNMTTDLLQRLDARAGTLQGQLRGLEDDARRAGAQPGLLR
jgi:hypothetical protein